MKLTSHSKIYLVTTLFILSFCVSTNAQVGIGTVTPNSSALLDLTNPALPAAQGGLLLPRVALTTGTTSPAPLAADVAGMTIYNTATVGDVTPGIYINNGANWERVEDLSPAATSVSMTGDNEISAAAYAAVPGMPDLVFTARKTSVMLILSASGFGYTNSMSYVQLRVQNVTSSTIIGGTNSKIQSYDDLTGTITPWSTSFSQLVTGLTIGTTYTLRVQGQVGGISGVYNAALFTTMFPDSHHLTLSVMH